MKDKETRIYDLAAARATLFIAAANSQKTFQYTHQLESAMRDLEMAAYRYGTLASRSVSGK